MIVFTLIYLGLAAVVAISIASLVRETTRSDCLRSSPASLPWR